MKLKNASKSLWGLGAVLSVYIAGDRVYSQTGDAQPAPPEESGTAETGNAAAPPSFSPSPLAQHSPDPSSPTATPSGVIPPVGITPAVIPFAPQPPLADPGSAGIANNASQLPFVGPVYPGSQNPQALPPYGDPSTLGEFPPYYADGDPSTLTNPDSADLWGEAIPSSEAPPSTSSIQAPYPGWHSSQGGLPGSTGPGGQSSGFTNTPPQFPGSDFGSTILDGFSLSTSLSGSYDSNVTRSPGEPVAPIQGDFILSLGGTVSYLSKADDWTFGGNYRGRYNQYFEQTDYSGYDQGLGLIGNYNGTKLSASLTVGLSYDQGNNRYNQSNYVEQTTANANLNARYRLSAKTSLTANIGQTFTVTGGNNYNDSENFTAGIAALWRYSKLTEFGPGIRYTYRSGNSRTGLTTIGPDFTLNYKLSTKVRFNSRIGADFTQYEDGGAGDPLFSTSIGLDYQASSLWGLNLNLLRDARADGNNVDSLTEITSVRLGYRHRIRRASLNLGISYENNSSLNSGNLSTVNRPDRDYFTVDSSLGTMIFADTTSASIFLRYQDNSGSATDTWDSVQTGFSLSRSF